MVGVGIFLGPYVVAQHVVSPGLVLLAWSVGGLIVFCGALTYAELGAALPRAGGSYAYNREAYGPYVGFLTGWSAFIFGKAASVSALAVGFVHFLPDILRLVRPDVFAPGVEFTRVGAAAVAVSLVLIVSAVNVLGVRFAGGVAIVTSSVKIASLLLLVAGGLAVFAPEFHALLRAAPASGHAGDNGLLGGFALALVPVFFAYDGWTNSAQLAEEVRDPQRNVPRSLVLGVLTVIALYALANLTYLLAIGPENLTTPGAAVATARAIVGDAGAALVTLAILLSIVGTMNAVILSGPRIAYAMARDGVFPRMVQNVSRFGTPAWSIGLQSALSVALILLPPLGGRPLFETLLTYVIANAFLVYALSALALILLRRRRPDLPRPYKVPLYPIVPLAFISASLFFLANIALTRPQEAAAGLAIVVAGTPVYTYWARKTQNPA